MIHLSGATVVLPDRLLAPGRVSIHHGHITEVEPCRPGDDRDLEGHFIVPGFVDVHVHGIEGTDALDSADAIARIARRLPPFGVTAFCPTSIACTPAALREMLSGVRSSRESRSAGAARVLPAHLESNFISSDFKGAQPESCIRAPREVRAGDFSGADILDVIASARADVGIVTVAPEIDGVLDLIADLAGHGHRVSLGHSGATY